MLWQFITPRNNSSNMANNLYNLTLFPTYLLRRPLRLHQLQRPFRRPRPPRFTFSFLLYSLAQAPTVSAADTVQAIMEEKEFRTELKSNLSTVYSKLEEVAKKVDEFKGILLFLSFLIGTQHQ